jgi:hypothetical protein
MNGDGIVTLNAAVLQSILRRLDRLEARPTLSEALSANYITSDAAGNIGATFSGAIVAHGGVLLDTFTQAGSPMLRPQPVPSMVQWNRPGAGGPGPGDGAVTGDITSIQHFLPNTGTRLSLTAENPDGTGVVSIVSLFANGVDATQQATLIVQGGRASGSGANTTYVNVSNQQRTIVDDTGASSFLQLLSAQKLQIAFGGSSGTFTASNVSATLAVAHGLSGSPVFVGLQAENTNFIGTNLASVSATNFVVQLFYTPGTNISGTFNFGWVAIG